MRTLAELIAVLPRDGWYLDCAGAIRRLEGETAQCPLTAASRAVTGRTRRLMDWDLAAEDLNVPRALARQVVDAADKPRSSAVRQRLLRALRPRRRPAGEGPDAPF